MVQNLTTTDTKTNAMLSIKLGQMATGMLQPVNGKGEPVTFQKGSLTAGSSDDSFEVTISDDETSVTIKPLKAGKANCTLSITTNGGKVLNKMFDIEILESDVVNEDHEAVDIIIKFVIG